MRHLVMFRNNKYCVLKGRRSHRVKTVLTVDVRQRTHGHWRGGRHCVWRPYHLNHKKNAVRIW